MGQALPASALLRSEGMPNGCSQPTSVPTNAHHVLSDAHLSITMDLAMLALNSQSLNRACLTEDRFASGLRNTRFCARQISDGRLGCCFLTLNLSRDQEKFVKMTAQALTEWRESLGAVAWVILGVVLVLGLLASIWIWTRLLRGHSTFGEPRHGDHHSDQQNHF